MSKKTGEDRLYNSGGGHIYQAYRETRTDFEKLIQDYGRSAGITDFDDPKFRKMFKIQILEIVRFQGDQETTKILANEKEGFWIGFYHAQYREFGQNTAPQGGFLKYLPEISKAELDAAIDKLKYISKQQSPLKILYELIGLKPSQEDSVNKILKATYLHEKNPLMTEIKERQLKFIKDLVEKGYRSGKIAKIFNRLADQELWSISQSISQYKKGGIHKSTISERIKEIYKDIYPNMQAKYICIEITKNRIESLVSQGYASYSDLIIFFPAFQDHQDPSNPQSYKRLKDFVVSHFTGALRGLKNKYSVKPISTKSKLFRSVYFPKALRLIRYYEKNSIAYTQAELFENLDIQLSYHSKLFKRKFGMTFTQYKQFALTGLLPHDLEHQRSKFESYI